MYEPGVHEVDYLNITNNNTVVYLRAGSLLVANHTFDIDSDSDRANKVEPMALAASAGAINRFPFMRAKGRQNVKVLGRGIMSKGCGVHIPQMETLAGVAGFRGRAGAMDLGGGFADDSRTVASRSADAAMDARTPARLCAGGAGNGHQRDSVSPC